MLRNTHAERVTPGDAPLVRCPGSGPDNRSVAGAARHERRSQRDRHDELIPPHEIHAEPASPEASHAPQIICKFGVNALSSKSPNAIKLNALGRLIEGPGRPNKQRFAIPAMAQGVQPRLLTATSGTRPLRVVRGASYRGRWPLHFRLTVSTDLATLCSASPFCFWRRFFRGTGRLDVKSCAPACSPRRVDRGTCAAFSSRLCDVPRRLL
jgi:hypothetical protein